jgi:tRNA dimethylallyltransferase
MNKNKLIVIVGPTAVGKTSTSLELANFFKGEIISADSRQFFKELEIGTAKPSSQELALVPHHFINSHSIDQEYDVGAFERDVISLLEVKFKLHDCMFLVGGSGLYVNAICEGLDKFPEIDKSVRDQLNDQLENDGLDSLVLKLKDVDPEYSQSVDLKNPQRVIRALEVSISTGQPFSSFRKSNKAKRPFDIIKIGLEMERPKLYERIDQRMDQMINDGLFEEAIKFKDYQHLNALQTVGYKEIFGYMNGEYTRDESIRLLKRNSRRYAKRQLTWFKKDANTEWFKPDDFGNIKKYLEQKLLE